MLRWLIGPGIFSMIASMVIVRLFDTLIEEATVATNAAKGTLAGGVWAAISVRSGRNGFNKTMRRLRPRILTATKTIDTVTKDRRR